MYASAVSVAPNAPLSEKASRDAHPAGSARSFDLGAQARQSVRTFAADRLDGAEAAQSWADGDHFTFDFWDSSAFTAQAGGHGFGQATIYCRRAGDVVHEPV